jgi:hypothetical protein
LLPASSQNSLGLEAIETILILYSNHISLLLLKKESNHISSIKMSMRNNNPHLLTFSSLAGSVIGLAYWYWKSQDSHDWRRDADAITLFNDGDWERLLNRYSSGVKSIASSSGSGGSSDAAAVDDDCIYLDYNGTTPVYPQVLVAMLPYLTTHYGNPSSGHAFGKEPKRAVDEARKTILKTCLGIDGRTLDPTALWFCACGTESDNLAIQLALQSSSKDFPHIVTCNVEHPAIAVCLEALEKEGRISVTYVPVGNGWACQSRRYDCCD